MQNTKAPYNNTLPYNTKYNRALKFDTSLQYKKTPYNNTSLQYKTNSTLQ